MRTITVSVWYRCVVDEISGKGQTLKKWFINMIDIRRQNLPCNNKELDLNSLFFIFSVKITHTHKLFKSTLSIEFLRHCMLNGETQRRSALPEER